MAASEDPIVGTNFYLELDGVQSRDHVARRNRQEIIAALSHGTVSRRELLKWGLFSSSGALAWIETAQLAATRNIVVKTATQIRSQAADNASVSGQVAAGVVLPWLENINNWAKVRLPDQSVGYIRLEQVWGA